jgi:putative ubiquitin-RnfH superfamily antitoxin RatB of RatAB toxin-antitoxin module
MVKCCSVVCDTPAGIVSCELELADDATIAEALAAARARLGEQAADWERAAAGIYGQVYPREHVPADGERIELYRPLQVDPRAGRRARAASATGRRRS